MANISQIIDCLRLINTEGIGAVSYAKFIKTYGTAAASLAFLSKQNKKIPSLNWAEKEIELSQKYNVRILLTDDEDYPLLLKNLHDAPPVLYAKGKTELLNAQPAVAVVGSRNASLNARKLTEKIAFDLTEKNVLIISGMARGIDAAAHNGALEACSGHGSTIAVLGTGIDKIYPPENSNLYHLIENQGLLLSEVSFNSSATAANFPRRNRIVAGLSAGVLVTEASEKSGSLITAKFGAAQNKLLFAIPGNPLDPRAAGTNRLLKSGAVLTESAEDILKVLNSPQNILSKPKPADFCGDLFTNALDNCTKTTDISTNPKYPIEDFLSAEPADIDEIIRCSELDTATVMMQILDLEMEGKIIRLPGNKIALSGKTRK